MINSPPSRDPTDCKAKARPPWKPLPARAHREFMIRSWHRKSAELLLYAAARSRETRRVAPTGACLRVQLQPGPEPQVASNFLAQ